MIAGQHPTMIVVGVGTVQFGQDAADMLFGGALGDPQPMRAIPAVDRPSAINASTSRSRLVISAIGSLRRRAPSNSFTTAGSTTEAPLAVV